MMKASYELRRDDLAALIEFHQRTSPAARNYCLGCLTFLFLALLVLPVGMLLSTDKPRLQVAVDIWPLFVGPVLFAVFAGPYINWRTRKTAHRFLGEGRNEGFYGQCETILEPEGIRESRPSGSTTRNWSSVERIAVTPQHLFVYTSGIEAFVVPRRVFSTDADFAEFARAIGDRSGSPIEST